MMSFFGMSKNNLSHHSQILPPGQSGNKFFIIPVFVEEALKGVRGERIPLLRAEDRQRRAAAEAVFQIRAPAAFAVVRDAVLHRLAGEVQIVTFGEDGGKPVPFDIAEHNAVPVKPAGHLQAGVNVAVCPHGNHAAHTAADRQRFPVFYVAFLHRLQEKCPFLRRELDDLPDAEIRQV